MIDVTNVGGGISEDGSAGIDSCSCDECKCCCLISNDTTTATSIEVTYDEY